MSVDKKAKRKLKSKTKRTQRNKRAAHDVSVVKRKTQEALFGLDGAADLRARAKEVVERAVNGKQSKKDKPKELTTEKLKTDIVTTLRQFVRHHALAVYLERMSTEVPESISGEQIPLIKTAVEDTDRLTVKFLEDSTWLISLMETNEGLTPKQQNMLLGEEPLSSLIANMYFTIMEAINDVFPILAEYATQYSEWINTKYDEDEAAYRVNPGRSENIDFVTSVHLKRIGEVTPLYQTPAEQKEEENNV